MSDILEKLMACENKAAELIHNAEEEARKRINKGKTKVKEHYEEQLKKKIVELKRAKENQREVILKIKEKSIGDFREQLKKAPLDEAGFQKTVLKLLKKE
jgi:predicted DNA-binding protein (UPF0278 family)